MNRNNRLLLILSYLHSNTNGITAQDISESLDIPLSTVYRILKNLKYWGFVTEGINTESFVVGPTVYQATHIFQSQSFLANSFKPFLENLVQETKETAAIIIPSPFYTLCVDLVESPLSLKCSFSIGSKQSLVKGASAKTILAFQDSEKTEAILTQFVDTNHIQSIRKNLSLIKKIGYGISTGEIDAEIWGVSFPLFKKGLLIAVLTTMVPYYRVENKKDSLIDLTKKHASLINSFLSNFY